MIGYEQAIDIIKSTAQTLPAERLPLAEAAGAVAAADVPSPGPVPPFDNSAMDGFAVRSADTRGAGDDDPLQLRVVGMVTAGEAGSSAAAAPGTAWEIMTGAPVPAGYDGVIPVEQVQVERDPTGKPVAIWLRQEVAAGRNLRSAGEDFAQGDLVLQAGQPINASRIMGLAATGINAVPARRPVRMAAITTGNELTDTGAQLQPGKIHDSNGPYLAAAISSVGAVSAGLYRTGDEADALIDRIRSLEGDTDIILTTGGVSAGRMDFVPRALEELGADILFHRVAIRPGKPVLFARLPDGRLVFGLPGNPIAVATGLRFFVVPAVRCLQGQAAEEFPTAVLDAEHHKKAGLTFFAKAHARTDEQGVLRATILPGQESFKIQPLLRANCWVIGPAAADTLPAGSTVAVASLGNPGIA